MKLSQPATPFGPSNSGRMSPPADDASRHHRGHGHDRRRTTCQPSDLDDIALSRRRFLRNAALTGGGLVAAAGLAACAPAGRAPAGRSGRRSRAGSARRRPGRPPPPRPPPRPRRRACPWRRRPPRPPRPPPPAAHAARLDRARRRRPQEGIRRYIGNLAPALQDIYPARDLRQDRRHAGGRGQLPGAQPEAGVRPGPAALPQRRGQAADARPSTATSRSSSSRSTRSSSTSTS